jgi:hypothetical protein
MVPHVLADLLIPLLGLLGVLLLAGILDLLLFLRRLRQSEPEAWAHLAQPDLFSYSPAAALRLMHYIGGSEAASLEDKRLRSSVRDLRLLSRLIAGCLGLLVLLELIVNLTRS